MLRRDTRTDCDKRDLTGQLIAWEDGSLSEAATINLFQRLVDTGLAWTLQGVYARTAQRLIDAGLVVRFGPNP